MILVTRKRINPLFLEHLAIPKERSIQDYS